MKTKFYFTLVLFMLLGQEILTGMSFECSTRQSTPSSIAMRHHFAKVVTRMTDGKSHYGLLAGVENDCLILKEGTREERVSYRDISEVTIESGKHTGSLMATGMVLGIYLGNVSFSRADGQPSAYIDHDFHSEFVYFLMDFVYASAGIGLGYLASLLEKGEAVFRFSGKETERLAEWERLRGFLSGRPEEKKIHLSIQAGRVFTSVHDRYRNAFANAGYDTGYGFGIESPGYENYEYVEAARRFNLLRKAQLTISLRPKIEIGAAVVFSGEPGVGGADYGGAGYRSVWQTYNSVGYYAVASYKPLGESRPRKFQWKIGLGLGASRVDFKLGAHSYGGHPDYEEKWAEHKLVQTVPSGLAFTELGYRLGPNISLGLTGDYVFGPSRNIPRFPEWNIPAQKIHLGNGCAGIVLGMHF